jgi:hypothetical protein
MNKNIEIISLVYKSKIYFSSIYMQLKHIKIKDWDVGIRIVANDPTPEIVNLFPQNFCEIYNDKNPNDYYLNRVYRCYNYAGMSSKYDNICFVNSDMIFSTGWLENLLKYDLDKYIPCSRLVESGKMSSGLHGLSYNLGRNPHNFNYDEWTTVAKQLAIKNFSMDKGLYMPCVFNKQRFIDSGMYPEGNIYDNGIGTRTGNLIKSGDAYFFEDILAKKYGMKHITAFDSLVYHIQEGEKDE